MSAVRDRPHGRASRSADVLALLVLLVLALGSVRDALTSSREPVLGVEARTHVAWEIETRRAFAAGELPLWNPRQFAGRPHLADASTLAWYLPSMVMRWVPVDRFFPAVFVLHAWWAGIGGYLLLRAIGLGSVGATAGAAAVMWAGVLAGGVDVAYDPERYHLAWIPLVAAAAWRSAQRPSGWVSPALVLATALLFSTGSPRGAAYALGAIAASTAFAAIGETGVLRRTAVRTCVVVLLAGGLSAFQTLPFVWLARSRHVAGGLARDVVAEGSWHPTDRRPVRVPENMAGALRPLQEGGRAITACTGAVDESQLLALGIPSVGGVGGVYRADYARFLAIASGTYPEKPAVFGGFSGAGADPTRADLLRLLHAEYLVSCDTPDLRHWQPVARTSHAVVSRRLEESHAAMWTCVPQAMGREEIEYRLRRYRYDGRLVLHETGPVIHVRWAPQTTDAERAQIEAARRIVPERFLGDRTWQYELIDGSADNVAALLGNPLVEDTAGLDRGNLALIPARHDFSSEPKTEWLVGTEPCPESRPVLVDVRDRSDGRIQAHVEAPRDGIVVFSEPYDPNRRAWVDDVPATTLQVNLALTAVPISAGRHRVELRYDVRPLWYGVAISLSTIAVWATMSRFRRRGRADSGSMTNEGSVL